MVTGWTISTSNIQNMKISRGSDQLRTLLIAFTVVIAVSLVSLCPAHCAPLVDEQRLKGIRSGLESADQTVRRTAVQDAANYSSSGAQSVNELISYPRMAEDLTREVMDPQVPDSIWWLLSKCGPKAKAVIPALVARLDYRFARIDTLADVVGGMDALAAQLRKSLDHGPDGVRLGAAKGLTEIGLYTGDRPTNGSIPSAGRRLAKGIPYLVGKLNDPDPRIVQVLSDGILMLSIYAPAATWTESMPSLRAAMKRGSKLERRTAVRIASIMPVPILQVLDDLIVCTTSTDYETHKYALFGLERCMSINPQLTAQRVFVNIGSPKVDERERAFNRVEAVLEAISHYALWGSGAERPTERYYTFTISKERSLSDAEDHATELQLMTALKSGIGDPDPAIRKISDRILLKMGRGLNQMLSFGGIRTSYHRDDARPLSDLLRDAGGALRGDSPSVANEMTTLAGQLVGLRAVM